MNGLKTMKNNGIVIFGGTGDLAYRKLFPALYNLFCLGKLPRDYRIVGIGRRDYSQEDYKNIVRDWMKDFSRLKYTESDFNEFKELIHYYEMDMSKEEDYNGLIDFLNNQGIIKSELIYYYAVSPQLFLPITNGLKKVQCCTGKTKVIIEKPFGENIESAEKVYDSLREYFKDENIYHIDHYLGKEMIINIMTLRFENAIFSGVWNKDFIEKVEINAYESVGVDSRGGYYDKSGALADMVQNHLFQIMSIVAMEKPEDSSSYMIKEAQGEVFKSLKPIISENIDENLVMGQYKGYREEEKVNSDSTTETYVSLKVEIDNDRWRGVPFILRTGKKLHTRESEVVISFKSMSKNAGGNSIIIKIQPDEGVKLDFNIKKPGTENQIEKVGMDFCQSCILENRENTPEAYERLLYACMESDRSLFSQWNHIELSWNYINNIIDSYKKYSNKLYMYEQGTKGPKEAL
ncbi:glucose-6-phosphate dehydrogenase [Peptostreptococcus canis]|nr:glucose-6-phosphate 1-dehydrogenase [Peptostreptococcus canis]